MRCQGCVERMSIENMDTKVLTELYERSDTAPDDANVASMAWTAVKDLKIYLKLKYCILIMCFYFLFVIAGRAAEGMKQGSNNSQLFKYTFKMYILIQKTNIFKPNILFCRYWTKEIFTRGAFRRVNNLLFIFEN